MVIALFTSYVCLGLTIAWFWWGFTASPTKPVHLHLGCQVVDHVEICITHSSVPPEVL